MKFRPGVLTGDEVTELFNDAKDRKFAIPAVNVIGINSLNATLEAARLVQSPVIIQLSHAGARFFGGMGLPNNGQQASIAGAVSAAYHVHQVAHLYGVSVVLHTDHADRNLLPWVDSLLDENRTYLERTGHPLFSSHMLDLSVEPLEENINTCCAYLKKMSELGLTLEMELGVTGGVEDGFDHSGVDQSKLYTQPEEVLQAYRQLSHLSERFTVAAAFGNVHGVYKPGNVELKPQILRDAQILIRIKCNTPANPVKFVFHGGSGCSREEIREAISYGTVKMNINTDLQWAFWDGIRNYYCENEDYLQTQIGNPQGTDQPNKTWYNPQVWLREGEKSIVKRLGQYFEYLNCTGRNK
jgi:fructose-bisphosphate aldolase, class II